MAFWSYRSGLLLYICWVVLDLPSCIVCVQFIFSWLFQSIVGSLINQTGGKGLGAMVTWAGSAFAMFIH